MDKVKKTYFKIIDTLCCVENVMYFHLLCLWSDSENGIKR